MDAAETTAGQKQTNSGASSTVEEHGSSSVNNVAGSFLDFVAAMHGAYAAGVQFAAVSLPGEDVRFLCDDGRQTLLSDDSFVAVPWLGKFEDGVIIRDALTTTEASALPAEDMPSMEDNTACLPTDKNDYLAGIARVVADLRKGGGKTVIASVITGETEMDALNFAVGYLDDASRDSYRCIFYAPQTGLWVLVSPEVLLDVNTRSGELYTMALAGTRPAGTVGEWDEKNIEEQSIVTGFITECLEKNGCHGLYLVKGTRRAANVEHIVTHIKARTGECTELRRLLDELSPTPALCGLPRDISIERIARTETFPRRMYGGYTAFVAGDRFYSAVTLRCVCFNRSGWCVYAGGGITAASVPEHEWRETRMKAAPLVEALRSHRHSI